jgi:outer membrane protein assembly factor BamA
MCKPYRLTAIIISILKYCPAFFTTLFFFNSFAQSYNSDLKITYASALDYLNKEKNAAVNDSTPFVIGEINITGNKKTKSYIIDRELSFKKGDTVNLPELVKAFRKGHDNLINTLLFNDVVIYLKGFRGYIADVEIEVKERWYIFPVPYFVPIDRNLAAWGEKNYSFSRVNYGIKYTHFNFTGRNDNLMAWLITGYSQQVELAYTNPYIDKSLKHGFGFSATYAAMKQLDAATINNEQYFVNSDTVSYSGKYLSKEFSFSLRYYYRPALKVRHFFRINYNNISIDSAVTVFNPYYFNNNKRSFSFPEFIYALNYTDVDYVAYPLKGVMFETGLLKRGINSNMNMTQFYFKSTESWNIAWKTFFVTQNEAMVKLPLDQPFYNQQYLGYGDLYLRGLDRYVVEGVVGTMFRNSLLRELFDFKVPFLRSVPSHAFVPIRIYACLFSDFGYVYNKNFTENSLVNRSLYTAGVGLDVVTFYDLVLRIDYSFNQLGQNGLFLHIRNDF